MKNYEYEVMITCGDCNGDKQTGHWETIRDIDVWVIADCEHCGATGKIKLKVIDKRRIATIKSAILPDKD